MFVNISIERWEIWLTVYIWEQFCVQFFDYVRPLYIISSLPEWDNRNIFNLSFAKVIPIKIEFYFHFIYSSTLLHTSLVNFGPSAFSSFLILIVMNM